MPCNRCLTESRKELSHSISHVLVNKLNDEEDFDDYIVVEGETLDLDELIYSDIILLTPSKYVCKEDCRGFARPVGRTSMKATAPVRSSRQTPHGGPARAAPMILDHQRFSLL